MEWTFKRAEKEFEELPVGKYRLKVKSAENAVSKSGNDMIVLQFNVSGSKKILWHYIVCLKDRPEITNRNLTNLFNSFGFEPGKENLNIKSWVGLACACQTKIDEDGYAKISYFLDK